MGKRARAHARMYCAQKMVLTLGVALPFGAALAQATGSTAPAATTEAPQSGSSLQLETMTVTAQRRVEKIKDVPISVTLLKGETLDVLNSGGQDIRVLAGKVPSLNIESSNGRTFPRFYIRGYGNTDFSTFASQPVSLIFDDVVQENAALKGFPMFDLAGVEVLRGPQGTLFGRNTPAGVVKFDSAKPNLDKVSGYYSVSDGTHNTANVEAAVNVPLSDQWAMRFSTLLQHRDNWVTNNGGGTPFLEGYDEQAGRLQFLYKPDGTFNALFNIHARATTGSARLFRANILEKGSDGFVAGFDPSQITTNAINTQALHTAGGSARLSWNLDQVKLYSITGYETISSYFSRGDIDGGTPTGPGFIPFQVQTGGGVADHKQFSQEFRVESKNEGPLNWQTGLYYFYEDVAGNSSNFSSTTQLQTSYLQNRQKNTAYAVFGSLTYDVNDRLKLRGGLRYTEDKKDFSNEVANNVTFTGPGAISENKSNVSWDLSANYALTKDISTYARVATGFRAPSIAAPSSSVPITVANAETITSYEAGIKADLFNRRARANFSVYSFDVKNQQLTAVGGNSNSIMLINAAKTVGRGAELDLEANLSERLRVTVGGSYNYTQIRDPNLLVAGCASCTMLNTQVRPGLYSIDGNPLPQAPKWIANVTARYGIPMGNNDELFFYTDWAYRSKINFFLYNSTEFTGKPLLEGGLRIGYKWDGDKYEVAAFARNITNKIVAVGGIDFDNRTAFINDPRMFGVQFRSNF
ncbi:TonB-dependent receptor [Collimonas fungivorans]|uniref:TonB-dependent receptor n=1 Tax=Collimonas fungivorans TaxID=158899 RepID=UPI003FA39226